MAKERLSKQQKWILQYLYKAHSDPSSEYNDNQKGGLCGYQAQAIFAAFEKSDACEYSDPISSDSRQSSFSRALINMEDKGLIEVDRPRYTRSLTATRPHRGYARRVVLSDKGVETANTLAASEAQI